jgi:hypothetical protein
MSVTMPELRAMMREADKARGGLIGDDDHDKGGPVRFTPWSRAIMDKFLFVWWEDLQHLDRHVDPGRIHRIGRVDP